MLILLLVLCSLLLKTGKDFFYCDMKDKGN